MLTALALLSLVYWLAVAVTAELSRRAVRRPPVAAERAAWPRLSVIIPARDEAEHVSAALKARLADDYPNLELVFVNDRSSDGTGAAADALAQVDARLKVVHVRELPAGWLGKLNAMQRGLEQATGEWVLFSDADVAWRPGTLRGVVQYAEAERADHVAMLPRITGRGVLLEAALAAFFRVIVLGGRLWSVATPGSSAAVGVGAFNLVRRVALAQTAGFEWLKMEIGDDMALGVMLKRAGFASRVLNGRDHLSLDFYASYGAMARAVEKNGASAPFPVLVLVNVALVACELGFFAGPAPVVLAGFALSSFAALRVSAWLGLPRWPSLVAGAGMVLLGVAMVRSAVLCLVRGGVLWRGTLYPTAEVRAGNRLGVVPSAKRKAL
ncbi:MAG: glycosyltransferase [Myxococcaceae bacterium]|nr:glycosyltransferase [Myxococcaceae bacterium]